MTQTLDASRRDALTLQRFLTPCAQPIQPGPPLPGFACPGHVASLHLPCVSTPYSLTGLPGVFSTRRAVGAFALQSLTRQRSSRSFEVTSPRAISNLAASSRHIAYCMSASLGLAVRRDRLFEPARHIRPVPLRSMALAALWAHEALLRSAASLQGFYPFAGWGHRARDSSLLRRPGSLGLCLPGAFPFPARRPHG